MTAVRVACVVTISAVVAGLWFTRAHNGLIVVGAVALWLLLWSFGVFTKRFWVEDAPAEPSVLDLRDRCCLVDHAEPEDDEERAA